MDKDISDFLNDEVEEEVIVEEAVEEQPRDESGRFAPKGVEESAPPAPVKELPQDVYEPLKAVRSENQQLKARIAEIERQYQESQNPPAPPPDVFDEGFGHHVTVSAATQATQEAVRASRLQTSEMLLMQEVPNLTEIKEQLMEFVGSNPAINEQVANSPHPWKAAYQAYQTFQTMQQVGATDIDSLRAQLRQEVLAELQQQQPQRQALPPSLANERSVGQRSGPAWTGPSALEDILR